MINNVNSNINHIHINNNMNNHIKKYSTCHENVLVIHFINYHMLYSHSLTCCFV